MKENREPRNKNPMDFWQRSKSNYMEESVFNKWFWEIVYMQTKKKKKKEPQLKPHTLFKNNLNIDSRFKCQILN